MIASAGGVVADDPVLWLLGIVGFGARGGLLFLALPILTIPSPVLLSIIFRGEIGTSGTTHSFDILAAIAALLTGAVALAAVLTSAWADLHAFERCVAAPRSGALRLGRTARAPRGAERNSLLLWIAAISATAMVPVLVLSILFLGRLGGIVAGELERPSDLGTPLLLRVVQDATPTLLVIAIVVGIMEVLVSLATRRLLTARAGLLPDGPGEPTETGLAVGGALRLVRQPIRVVGIALVSWLAALAALATAVVGLSLVWAAARPGLSSLSHPSDLGAYLGALILSVVIAGGVLAAFCVCGVASAFRSSLWTMDTLR